MTSIPGWLDPLFEAQEMRHVDAWAIETQGVPSLDLMERAGEGLARLTVAVARPGPVRVVVGKGNNGGDGLVVARLLRDEGREVDVLAVADIERAPRRREGEPGPAARRSAAPVRHRRTGGLRRRGGRDAGHRLRGEPREPIASAIAAINGQDAPVVAWTRRRGRRQHGSRRGGGDEGRR